MTAAEERVPKRLCLGRLQKSQQLPGESLDHGTSSTDASPTQSWPEGVSPRTFGGLSSADGLFACIRMPHSSFSKATTGTGATATRAMISVRSCAYHLKVYSYSSTQVHTTAIRGKGGRRHSRSDMRRKSQPLPKY